jgi:DNA polymerase I
LQSNALLGFANVLFKVLCDYRPKSAVVAWDRKPVKRLAVAADYKAGRKPMADGLSKQFPHFPSIVEAFGYRNISMEEWEADDVIATIASKAAATGISSLIISTDRDAFQLVSEAICLMMTPRGAAKPEVYTPERVIARYGLPPALIPDFISLKGDNSDNIQAVPGFGEKTAAALLAKYGSLESLIANVDALKPAQKRSLSEHVDAARAAKALATLNRTLPLDFDAAKAIAIQPDRSKMTETFERLEFRKILERRKLLDDAIPAR